MGHSRYVHKYLVTRREKIYIGTKQKKIFFSLKVDCILNRSFFYKTFLLYSCFFNIYYANFQSIIHRRIFSFFILSLSLECFVDGICANINVLFFSCHQLQICRQSVFTNTIIDDPVWRQKMFPDSLTLHHLTPSLSESNKITHFHFIYYFKKINIVIKVTSLTKNVHTWENEFLSLYCCISVIRWKLLPIVTRFECPFGKAFSQICNSISTAIFRDSFYSFRLADIFITILIIHDTLYEKNSKEKQKY